MSSDSLRCIQLLTNIKDDFIEEAYPFEQNGVEKPDFGKEPRKHRNFRRRRMTALSVVSILLMIGMVFTVITLKIPTDSPYESQALSPQEEQIQTEPPENDMKDPSNKEQEEPPEKGAKLKDETQTFLSLDDVEQAEYYPFLSEQLKEEYTYETGLFTPNEYGGKTILYYQSGANEMIVRITETEGTVNYEQRFVEASEVSKYDICNYDIPYSQTIPEELHICMENPIFAAEEFSRDVLRLRTEKRTEGADHRISVRLSVAICGYVLEYAYKGDPSDHLYELLLPSIPEQDP